MAAYRCSLCGIGYPDEYRFMSQCPHHKEPTWRDIKSEPDPDWQARLARLVANEARDAETADIIPHLTEAKVVLEDGLLWIHSWDVIDSGVRFRLTSDHLVRIGQQYFEVQGYDQTRRRYLVEPFSMELDDETLGRLGAP